MASELISSSHKNRKGIAVRIKWRGGIYKSLGGQKKCG